MSTDNDNGIYSEVSDDIFEMKRNKCSSEVKVVPPSKAKPTSKANGNKSSRRCMLVIFVFAAIIVLVLATTIVGVVYALVEITKLKQQSCVDSPLENVTAYLDRYTQELAEFRQDFHNSGVQELRAGHNRSTEELAELRQTFYDSGVQGLRADHNRSIEKLFDLRQNFSQFQYDLQRLSGEVHANCPAHISSCSSLPSSCPSGYYLLNLNLHYFFLYHVYKYCDMTFSCGNITGGWMRVVKLNMTDTSQQCPRGLVERNETGIRQCRIGENGCFSVYYYTEGVSYSQVCGRIKSYQVGSTNAFRDFYRGLATTIDSNYVTGVSLTHGTRPRQHIWTFAAALDKNDNLTEGRSSHCPCRFDVNPFDPPLFVGEDYFCDAGNDKFMTGETGLQTDPLWDGTDCLCCDNPPWFYKQLPQPTTDIIEMRVCKKESSENIGITEVEIYVQ